MINLASIQYLFAKLSIGELLLYYNRLENPKKQHPDIIYYKLYQIKSFNTRMIISLFLLYNKREIFRKWRKNL